jgi:phenylalanyl-tRNA synthetase alpha subunit
MIPKIAAAMKTISRTHLTAVIARKMKTQRKKGRVMMMKVMILMN